MKLGTELVHGSGRRHSPDTVASVVEPVYFCAVYRYYPELEKEIPHKLPFKYGREDNPTVAQLEEKLRVVDRGIDALAFSSGLAAINTVLRTVLKPRRSLIIAPLDLYGSTVTVLKMFAEREQIELVLSEPGTDKLAETLKSIHLKPDTEVIVLFFESVSNPVLRVYDMDALVKLARDLHLDKQVYVVVDNTIPTPVGIRPLEHGVDIVVYSASKYLGGHNDLIGGAAVFRSREVAEQAWDIRRLSGTIMDPMTAFLVDRGLKTLHIRMRRHEESARAIAEFLMEHPKVEEVIYPGISTHPDFRIAARLLECMSGIVSFRVRGGLEEALRVCRSTRLIVPGVSFGGAESIITHPYTTTHKYLSEEEKRVVGITPNLIRLSVGLEDPEDLIEDLDQALSRVP